LAAPVNAVELPPRYYLTNFLALCAEVERQYADLLDETEAEFLACFRALPQDSQCLFLRMHSRVGPWFRSARLQYEEIASIADALDNLIEVGLAVEADMLDVDDLGQLYTVPELRELFSAETMLPSRGTKAVLLEALAELDLDASVLATRAAQWEGQAVVAPLGAEYMALLQLLYFGNRRQDLTEFVLSDLGVFRYVDYSLDREHRLFPNRQSLEEYLFCGELADLYHLWHEQPEVDTLLELASVIEETSFVHEASRRRWFRLSNRVARDLERLNQCEAALGLYRGSALHPARERRARIHERLQDWNDAEALCSDIISAPWCEAEKEAAGKILQRVRRKTRGEKAKRVPVMYEEVRLQVRPHSGSVERDTARHLSKQWETVYYVENGLLNGLFGLAYWDQIFAPLPGAFTNPFQSVPADMYEQDFQLRRADLLAARRAELEHGDLATELLAMARSNRDLQNRWVNWNLIDDELLATALACVPREDLLAIFDRILFDPGENRRGFPDLIAFDGESRRYQMIEVKGPGDALQDGQKRWLNFFAARNIPALVAWVSWDDD